MDYESPNELYKRIGGLTRIPLPKDKNKLGDHLSELVAVQYDVVLEVANWHLKLAEVKQRMLYPKGKEYTELDRNIMLDAHVGVIRKDYELLCKLEELIRDRIELGKTLLTLF